MINGKEGGVVERKNPDYRRAPARDINTVEIDPAGEASVKGDIIVEDKHPDINSGSNYSGKGAYSSKKNIVSKEIKSYRPENSLILDVTVYSWDGSPSFFERFTADAIISHGKTASPSPYFPFFSYIPQYRQMNRQQAQFYFWFRENARKGTYIQTDFAYILLYVYEIINLPELILPEVGLRLLKGLWLGYREAFPALDKYMCEWVPDYCLINGLASPKLPPDLIPVIVKKASLKEFFLTDAAAAFSGKNVKSMELARILLSASSDYDPANSSYADECSEDFLLHIPNALSHTIKKMSESGEGLFSGEYCRPVNLMRDAYCGSLCGQLIRRKLKLTYLPFGRFTDARKLVTAIVKYSENRIRAAHHLKSRLGKDGLTEFAKAAVDEYFDIHMPADKGRCSERKSVRNPEPENNYSHLYEPRVSDFTPETASLIDYASWESTIRLVEDELRAAESELKSFEDIEKFSANNNVVSEKNQERDKNADIKVCTDSNDSLIKDEYKSDSRAEDNGDPIYKALTEKGGAALSALKELCFGGSFSSACKDAGELPDAVASFINSVFSEHFGDIILEEYNKDFKIIDDYENEVKEWVR